MKVLLDENLPHRLRHLIVGHDVFTTDYKGWKGTSNGRLLERAAAEEFDVLLTMDAAVEHEQDLGNLPIGVVIMHARSNAFVDLLHRARRAARAQRDRNQAVRRPRAQVTAAGA